MTLSVRRSLAVLALGAAIQQAETPSTIAPPASGLPEAAQPTTTTSTRFLAFDLFIDPHGQPLAAYQIEITSGTGPFSNHPHSISKGPLR